MEQNKQPSGQPRKPEQQPRQTYRKQSQPKSPQGRRPQPKKKQQPNLRLALAACVLVAVVALVVIGLVACNSGQKAPLTIDPGTSAGAWAKNDAGYYFNSDGEPILAATKKGIDVSKYQGEVDWEKAQAAGIDFAMIRCGFGSEWNGTGDYAQDDEPPPWHPLWHLSVLLRHHRGTGQIGSRTRCPPAGPCGTPARGAGRLHRHPLPAQLPGLL